MKQSRLFRVLRPPSMAARRPRRVIRYGAGMLGILLMIMTTPLYGNQMSEELEDALLEIAAGYPEATIAVSIRDDASGIMMDMNGRRSFHAASTMKTPIAIEIFRRAYEGTLSLDDSLIVENRFISIVDGSEYQIQSDSDDTIYEKLGDTMSIRDLAFQMITVSSNLATNILIGEFSAESVQATVDRLGGDGVNVLRGVEDLKAFEAGMNNSTTAYGLAELFYALMRHEAISPEADQDLIDIHLKQQFDDMIPAGLPPSARVAHKIGSITEIHHDAGIVYPEGADPYVIVILTEGLEDDERSAELGAALAATVHEHLRG